MHLRYTIDEKGRRVYTLKNNLEDGTFTFNAHPGNNYTYCKIILIISI